MRPWFEAIEQATNRMRELAQLEEWLLSVPDERLSELVSAVNEEKPVKTRALGAVRNWRPHADSQRLDRTRNLGQLSLGCLRLAMRLDIEQRNQRRRLQSAP